MLVADAVLGERLREGDVQAFGDLYERYAPEVHDFLVRLVRDRAAAEDLAQTTFVQAFEHRNALKDPEKVRSWLWTTAHNLAINYVKRRRPSESIEDQPDLAEPSPGPEDTVISRQAAELVWAAAASLEPRQYAVLDLSVRHGLSTAEVAESLGTGAGHAAVLVNRAHEALGNAVRYLLVARRREACPQLAALIPASVRKLTPEQRSTVDHHMRRCEDCRALGSRLTTPVELFGGLVPVPSGTFAGAGASQLMNTIAQAHRGGGIRGGKRATPSTSATRVGMLGSLAAPAQALVAVAASAAIMVAAPAVHIAASAAQQDVITPDQAGRLFQAAWRAGAEANRAHDDSALNSSFSGQAFAYARSEVLSSLGSRSDFEQALSVREAIVPHQSTFPASFVAVGHVNNSPAWNSAAFVIAFFLRQNSGDRWKMDLLSTEADKVALPRFAIGSDGYARGVSTTETDLLVAPSQLPALLANYFNDGIAGRPLGALFAPGPNTTDGVKGILADIQREQGQSVLLQPSYGASPNAVRHAYVLADGSALIFFVIDENILWTGYGISQCPRGFGYNYAFGPFRQERLSRMQWHTVGAVVALDPKGKPPGSASGVTGTTAISVLSVKDAVVSIDATPC